MSSPRKLPLDLEEEILVRVPPRSLVRFRTVCKTWNTLLNNKRFANKQLPFARPEFMLHTDHRTYSVSVNLNNEDPTTKVRNFYFDFTKIYGTDHHTYDDCGNSDGYFFLYQPYEFRPCGVVWNPFFRQVRWIQTMVFSFNLCGMVYNGNGPDKSYNKIVGTSYCFEDDHQGIIMFDFETNAWKSIDHAGYVAKHTREQSLRYNNVSLNGNLYWTAYNLETGRYFIRFLDLLEERVKPFCVLPCKKRNYSHSHVLAIYKGDRFSLLEHCKETSKSKIWVTKNKISSRGDGDDVVWIKFMTISRPSYPRFYHKFSRYMVEDNIYGKTFIMCCSNNRNGQAYVYIVRGGKCKKIKIDEVPTQSGCSFHVPSLIPFT
ncbi:hypothetical protein CARUB_v10021461mg [Capsella rubella]|uniref:F-box domain-containing protein n=1 Tax=Capsella rubella TaxID=81985 RepID=R0GEB6_9BRAS|nr:putative F-box protein At1g58090 [Capsella rubella]EOA33966.1 hypothetical protein CARUB_v10021461mg [Capsella rubella]